MYRQPPDRPTMNANQALREIIDALRESLEECEDENARIKAGLKVLLDQYCMGGDSRRAAEAHVFGDIKRLLKGEAI